MLLPLVLYRIRVRRSEAVICRTEEMQADKLNAESSMQLDKPNAEGSMRVERANPKVALTGGLLCGLVYTLASTAQQYGILYTTIGKAGFITTLYIIFVPIFGIFLKKGTRHCVDWSHARSSGDVPFMYDGEPHHYER